MNNSVTYQYAKDYSLMSDVGDNVRYYGADPDNYIYFNCDDYSDQSSSTCETWRIVGVFDGKVKIVRSESIGNYSWDTSDGNQNYYEGVNQWGPSVYIEDTMDAVGNPISAGDVYGGADLMRLLNPGYEENMDYEDTNAADDMTLEGDVGQATLILVNNSLYYTAGSGNCYYSYAGEVTSCDFTSTGLQNDTTRNLISETLYYLGATDDVSKYSNALYEDERGNLVGENASDGITRTTTWTGKVGLLYPSDYGYASDFQSCSLVLGSYSNTNCSSKNWIKSILGSTNGTWFLTPFTDDTVEGVTMVDSSGSLSYMDPYGSVSGTGNTETTAVFPTLYLSSELRTKAGTGDVNSPYQLLV